MKIDKTTYKDRKENQIGMTADYTSQPDKALFFADPHFLFFKSYTQMAHCLLPGTQAIASQKSKSHFFKKLNFNSIPIINKSRLPKSDKSRHNLNFIKMKKTVH